MRHRRRKPPLGVARFQEYRELVPRTRGVRAYLAAGGVMHHSRRRFLNLAGAAAMLPALPLTALSLRRAAAQAQTYPNRPIRWIVSFAAGGANDIVARLMGPYLTEKLGQQIIVDDRGGAGGNIGMAAVLSSPPDGYTIGFVAPNNAINATL